ncbi:MAG: ATP-binding protein [Spirochaetae bacterium HGW-Spirochaetae-7]|jgi:fluoroquinolone transport system ATP-binding protein|nr:MAG: ATP-binding protein [Spirochaetae bacterium HGW-Spirochaetae-7]
MITVEGLRFTYPKARSEAVRGIDFKVSPGEVFGFLGPSGAGKSTTQKILLGSLRGYAGSAMVAGVEAARADAGYRALVGAAFEFPCFYQKLTGIENLSLFASFYPGPKDDARALLERLGLADAADRRVAEYSKGMKVRLNLARAVQHRPRILFLDEPTSGLDPANARIVRDIVRERAADGVAVFLTTHDMAAADAVCDRVAFIVDGMIAACDAPSALKRRYGRRAVVVDRAPAAGVEAAAVGDGTGAGQREFGFDGLADNAEFLAELRKPGLLGIRTLDSSLDSIFLALTGKELA